MLLLGACIEKTPPDLAPDAAEQIPQSCLGTLCSVHPQYEVLNWEAARLAVGALLLEVPGLFDNFSIVLHKLAR